MKRMTGLAVVLAVAIALAAAMAACGDREPQEHVFNLELQGGELVDGGAAWQVNQDDKVTLNYSVRPTGELPPPRVRP